MNVSEATQGTTVKLATQVSPDGLVWCPHEASQTSFEGGGLNSLLVPNFSPWLRLHIEVTGPSPYIKAIIYLCLRQ